MTTPNDDRTDLDKGDIRIYDNYVPALGIGDYIVNVTQTVSLKNTTVPDECYPASQPFSVQGPRYTLPPEDVFSCFPPNNAQGVFDQHLPHVVLTKKDLLWENNVFEDTAQAEQTPWLALLLFVEDEVQTSGQPVGTSDLLLVPETATPWKPNRTMVANIPASSFYDLDANGDRVKKTAPGADGILWPSLDPEWYESPDFLQTTMASVIDISPAAFTTLIPAKTDLRYLAHARQVDLTYKDSSLSGTGDGWYSVMVGNRLADPSTAGQPGKRNIVHLVSLEGFSSGGENSNIVTPPVGTTRVRMISFKNWTFTCLPEAGESFNELMLGLLKDADGTEKSTRFSLPTIEPAAGSDDEKYASQAVQNGYIPMRYQTRLGEQTFGWYRGPFSPVPVADFISSTQQTGPDPAGWQPFGTASSALIYDKTCGVFNVSYAVAWETGRLMALADPHFGQELMKWQRAGHRLMDLIFERVAQIPSLSAFEPANLNPANEKELLDLIEPYAVTDDFMAYLVTQFSAQLAPGPNGQPGDSPDPPLPPYPDVPSPVSNPQSIADLLTQPNVQDAIRQVGGRELDTIADWLAKLYLLMGLPFENLVAHKDLLPAESVRFFYLDPNYLAAMAEGALSIGIESSRDRFYQDLMKDLIWNTTFAAVQKARDLMLGDLAKVVPTGGTVPLDQESMSGMLLRSAVVSGWPGLEVSGYTGFTLDAAGSAVPDMTTLIKPLRLERLSSDVLLCIWPTVPKAVSIDEPREGVAFGFEDPPADKREGYYLYLRSLGAADYGTPLCTDEVIAAGGCQYQIDAAAHNLIDPVTRIVNIGGVLTQMETVLSSPTLNVYDFAVEMIKVPEQAVFATEPTQEQEEYHGR